MAFWIMSVGQERSDAWDKAKVFGEWGFATPRGSSIRAGDSLLLHRGGVGVSAVIRATGRVKTVSEATDKRRNWGQFDSGGEPIRHLYRFPFEVVEEYSNAVRPSYPSQGPDPEFGLHSAYLLTGLTPIDGPRFRRVVASLRALNKEAGTSSLPDYIAPETIQTESGASLNAHFSVKPAQTGSAVILESRGGRQGSSNYRNPDYSQALWYILSRLGSRNAILLDASVESRETAGLADSERRLALDSPYPLQLANQDAEDLRLQIQRAQRLIGRDPNAGPGGNNTKRLRLLVEVPGVGADELLAALAGGYLQPVAEAEQAIEILAGRRRGQGFATDAKVRTAIELRAMEVVRIELESEGWEVSNVSRKRSYDFHCRKAAEECRVEVKGSQGGPEEVFLTPNEVAHAQERADVWLAVVSGIVVDREADGALAARSGTLTWHRPWRVESGELVALGYKWIAPEGAASS